MLNDDKSNDDDDFEIIPEEWLQALLAMTGDKEVNARVVQRISEKTGQPPEKTELIISALIKVLAEYSRSN